MGIFTRDEAAETATCSPRAELMVRVDTSPTVREPEMEVIDA